MITLTNFVFTILISWALLGFIIMILIIIKTIEYFKKGSLTSEKNKKDIQTYEKIGRYGGNKNDNKKES